MTMTATWALPNKPLGAGRNGKRTDDPEDKLIQKILNVTYRTPKLASASSLNSSASTTMHRPAVQRSLSSHDLGVLCYPTKSLARRESQSRLRSWRDGPKHGTLTVDVTMACSLLAADLGGTSDPYVILHVAGQRRKTRIIKRTLEPVWDETFEFYAPLDEFLSSGVRFEVFDHDDLGMDDVLGACRVKLPPELRLHTVAETHDYFERLSPQGKLAFRITWTPDTPARVSVPSPAPSPAPADSPEGETTVERAEERIRAPVLLPTKFDYIQTFYGQHVRPKSATIFTREAFKHPSDNYRKV